MSHVRRSWVWVAVLVGGLAAGSAVGGPIDSGPPVGFGSTIQVQFTGVNPGSGSAGAYNWQTSQHHSGLVYSDPATNALITFCVEQTQFTSNSAQTYTLLPLTRGPNVPGPMSEGTANALRAMWAQYRSSVDTAAEAEAFQRAVWHLLANPSVVPLPPTRQPVASSFGGPPSLFELYTNPANWSSGYASLALMSNTSYQDQLVQVNFSSSEPQPAPVPEPGLLALGLLVPPAVLLRRRLAR